MEPSTTLLPPTASGSATHDPNLEVSEATRRRSRPAITHFAVLASVILPLTFVPYLLARRRVSALGQRVKHLETHLQSIHKDLSRLTKLETSLQAIQRDLRFITNESNSAMEDQRRTMTSLHEVMMETDEIRLQAQETAASQKAIMDTTQSDLQRLLEEARHARAQGEAIRALGPSLADVAAFMYEVELLMPVTSKANEKDRVEELRSVAFRLQNLPRQPVRQ
ncbi:hypothetical protein D9758_001294 [Tetrapyrgos nigripes]|uniref:Uncharacterized protein n=1 Tax=Tetrapyrgos nigripes TaxID=182062 RepID=A0A8H5GS70_9AGAR|nr:hypothetical protein D9758_001294 [Tetrapyrgos nigripes]